MCIYNLDFIFQHPEKQISAIEGSIIETLITMVMKLSESTFKPLLFKDGLIIDKYQLMSSVYYNMLTLSALKFCCRACF